MTKFIKICRQFVVNEFNGTVLYKNYPNMENVISTDEMRSLLIKFDTKKNQFKDFQEILDKNQDNHFPFASSIHKYLKKYDSLWYSIDFYDIQEK